MMIEEIFNSGDTAELRKVLESSSPAKITFFYIRSMKEKRNDFIKACEQEFKNRGIDIPVSR